MAVAKTIELNASSPEGLEEAVRAGLNRAGRSLRNVQGAWVKDIKLTLNDGEIDEWRVTMLVTFVLGDDDDASKDDEDEDEEDDEDDEDDD